MDAEDDRVVVNVAYRLPRTLSLNPLDFVVDEKLRIASMQASARFGHVFCVGDQILFVNGKTPRSRKDAISALSKRNVEIQVSVMRLASWQPVPVERALKTALKRRPGCFYFVALLKMNQHRKSLGFAVRKVGDRVFVSKVSPKGIAAKTLQAGDCILDVCEQKVLSDQMLKDMTVSTLRTHGVCSLLVERVDYAKINNSVYSSIVVSNDDLRDPVMPPDAAKIGMDQMSHLKRLLSSNKDTRNTRPVLRPESRCPSRSIREPQSEYVHSDGAEEIARAALPPAKPKPPPRAVVSQGSKPKTQPKVVETVKHVSFWPAEHVDLIPSDHSSLGLQRVKPRYEGTMRKLCRTRARRKSKSKSDSKSTSKSISISQSSSQSKSDSISVPVAD